MESLTGQSLFSDRFVLVHAVPTYIVTGFVLILVLGGAPGAFDPRRAWAHASALTLAQLVTLALLSVLVALILMALPLRLPTSTRWSPARAWHRAIFGRQQKAREVSRSRLEQLKGSRRSDPVTEQRLQSLDRRLRERYPPAVEQVQASAVGNVLSSVNERIFRDYGLDLSVAWPRLYPVLPDTVRTVADSRRDLTDGLGRLSTAFTVLVPVSLLLLLHSGPWLVVSLGLAILAWVTRSATAAAAVQFGESVRVAVELGGRR